MRISDWSSDVCSSDLPSPACSGRSKTQIARRNKRRVQRQGREAMRSEYRWGLIGLALHAGASVAQVAELPASTPDASTPPVDQAADHSGPLPTIPLRISEEHTSELQTIMRNLNAVVCLN